MEQPGNLIPLIDGDIFRYEIGFGAETGWTAITEGEETIPPFRYVEKLLLERLEAIRINVGTTEKGRLFLTEGKTFREDIAVTKPYKGTRKDNKPWHYTNLTVYMRDVLGAEIIRDIEADDAMAIAQVASGGTTIICSRDKDLRQVPGWSYGWELGRQPSFGPAYITPSGTLILSDDRKKLIGTGLASFYGQLLTGDVVDNIPGLKGCGPVAAYALLTDGDELLSSEQMFNVVREAYDDDEYMLEQGKLLWMCRGMREDGSPITYALGMEE